MLKPETAMLKFMQTPRKVKANCESNETMRAFFVLTPPPPIPTPIPDPSVIVKPVKKEVACKEIYVARYGKIYKRKAPSPMNCIKLNCAPGLRYCKLCDTHKPLVAFYTAVKRYVCRKCHKVLAFCVCVCLGFWLTLYFIRKGWESGSKSA